MAASATTVTRGHGSMATFNINDGYLEGIVRGFRSGFLSTVDYTNLGQCDSLEDMKMHLQSTDYGDFLANEPSPIHTTTIADQATNKLVREFVYLRGQSVEPLSTFLDYISYQYMIDNVVLLITGTLHDRDIGELVEKCHPLGWFESMATLSIATSVADLYNNVLVDTPLAPYIQDELTEEDLDEMNIEIIRNTLYKAYIEDFYRFCERLGGATFEIMKDILEFEADRRTINITLNSFGTELSKDDRIKLYPTIGTLYPEGTTRLGRADDNEQVRLALEGYSTFRRMFASRGDEALEDVFFEHEVHLNELAFETQFGYGVFYAYVKLREQEMRSLVWIAECCVQDQKAQASKYIPIFNR